MTSYTKAMLVMNRYNDQGHVRKVKSCRISLTGHINLLSFQFFSVVVK